MSKKRIPNSDRFSLFEKLNFFQSALFSKKDILINQTPKTLYRPIRFNEEIDILQNYIQNLKKECKQLLVSDKLLCHFLTKLEKLQDVNSREFFYFCDGLGTAGKKIKKALKLDSKKLKVKKKADLRQVSLEDIIRNVKGTLKNSKFYKQN